MQVSHAPCCGAVAAERWRLISCAISCLQGARQQTRRIPLLLLIDGTSYKRTDPQPFLPRDAMHPRY